MKNLVILCLIFACGCGSSSGSQAKLDVQSSSSAGIWNGALCPDGAPSCIQIKGAIEKIQFDSPTGIILLTDDNLIFYGSIQTENPINVNLQVLKDGIQIGELQLTDIRVWGSLSIVARYSVSSGWKDPAFGQGGEMRLAFDSIYNAIMPALDSLAGEWTVFESTNKDLMWTQLLLVPESAAYCPFEGPMIKGLLQSPENGLKLYRSILIGYNVCPNLSMAGFAWTEGNQIHIITNCIYLRIFIEKINENIS